MTRRWKRTGDGGLRVTLTEPERELLAALPDELRVVYGLPASENPAVEDPDVASPADDPVRARLFPRAYLDPTAEAAEREWRELVEPELVRERLEALDRVTAVLAVAQPAKRDQVTVDLEPDDVGALLGILNDARLALGIRIGITEETDLERFDPDDPDAAPTVAYAWLTHLQGELVEELLDDLPD